MIAGFLLVVAAAGAFGLALAVVGWLAGVIVRLLFGR
jgi:hypothetical protein